MALKEEEEEEKNFTKLPKFPQQKGIADTKTNKKKYWENAIFFGSITSLDYFH